MDNHIGEVNLDDLAAMPFGLSFSFMGFNFVEDGIHTYGGGDYHVTTANGESLGDLCWTKNKASRRRAAWTAKGKATIFHYCDDSLEALTWLTELLSAKA